MTRKFEVFPHNYEGQHASDIKYINLQESLAVGDAIKFIIKVFTDASKINIEKQGVV